MKHGRAVPFRKRRESRDDPERREYVANCAECGTEFTIGAPRWLPDAIVVKKFRQLGMEGRGFNIKEVPRELVCPQCLGVEEKMENELFDNLPRTPDPLRVRRIKHSSPRTATASHWVVRFAMPREFADFIWKHNKQLAAKLIKMDGGGVRFKLRVRKEGEIRPGGRRVQLEGNATKWFSVRLTTSATRPFLMLNESLTCELIGTTLANLKTDVEVPWARSSPKNYTAGEGEPAVAYECPDLAAYIGVAGGASAQPKSGHEAEPAATSPQGQTETEGIAAETEVAPVDEQTYMEYSVEGSMDQLHKNLENANLHLLNLQDKGWKPDVYIGQDGLIRVTVSRTLS